MSHHRDATVDDSLHLVGYGNPSLELNRLGTGFLLLNDICRKDGERSVEGAFTRGEAAALAERAGLAGAEVTTRLPFRFLLRWVRPGVVGS